MTLFGRAVGLLSGKGLARLLRRAGLVVVPLARGDGRASGVWLQWERDEPSTLRGAIVEHAVDGRTVRFFLTNERDEIQGEHRRGLFYEPEELAIIARHFKGGTFVDVGANVGNHSLYALLLLGAEKVIAFEPLPQAARILETNIALNGLQDRFVLHRQGLSDRPGRALPDSDPRKIDNLGAARFTASEDGLELVRGDEVISEPVHFIKIDTEGFELKVLQGLNETIEWNGPPLFVEVDDDHLEAFETLMAEWGYAIVERFKRYPGNINLMAVPAGTREPRGAA